MKKLILVALVILTTFSAQSQITLTATSGTASGSYATLKGAFDAINAGTHMGAIVISVNASTTETASATLNVSSGTANYTSVLIRPTTTDLSISGSIAGAPLIFLNGATNVTIDGRVNGTGSTKSLIISNTSTSALTGTSTIKMDNTAQNHLIKYCILKGSATQGASTNSGIILISFTGQNDNITIDHNDFTNAGSRPTSSIIKVYQSTPANYNIVISNNNTYDCINLTTTAYLFDCDSPSATIIGNSFYETTPISSTYPNTIRVISSTFSTKSGTIKNNFIGGSGPNCSGTLNIIGGGARFTGIYTAGTTTEAASIQGNTIQNINITTNTGTFFYGMELRNKVNVGTEIGNTIGAATGNGSITLTGATTGGAVYGIYSYQTSSTNLNIQNNQIGSITADNSVASNSNSIYGIYLNYYDDLIAIIKNNTIGSTDAGTTNSLWAKSTSTTSVQDLYGIYLNNISANQFIANNTVSKLTNATTYSSGITNGIYVAVGTSNQSYPTIVDGNKIQDISTAGATVGINHAACLTGIVVKNALTNKMYLTNNTISGLTNVNSSFAGEVNGFVLSGSTTSTTVNNNFINNLTVHASSVGASIGGLRVVAGSGSFSNNIIGLTGNTNTTIYGIYDDGASGTTNSYYFNTIYLGGTSTGTQKSYGFFSNSTVNTKNLKNNVFYNARSTAAASNYHYAAYFPSATSLTLDYNNYYVTGTGGTIGYVGGANKSVLPLSTGQDVNSISIDPSFANAAGVLPVNYSTAATMPGITISGITADILTNIRSITTPKMGAVETAVVTNTVDVYIGASLQASYTNIKNAFDAINAGTHTGALILKLTASEYLINSAVLNASGVGAASYSSVLIYPTITGITISGNLTVPLIDFSGADNITLDGRVNATGSTKDLTISNTSNDYSEGLSTIRFINDASDNTVQYCQIMGAATNQSRSGSIYLSTGTVTGNNNISILNNNFTAVSNVLRPTNGIYSYGTSASIMNKNSVISNNHFFDLFGGSNTVYVINLNDYTDAASITGNSIFQTTTLIPAGAGSFYGIYIYAPNGAGFSVSDNFIGGSTANCGGSAFSKTTANSNHFTGIHIYTGTSKSSTIQNNTIKNISWLNGGGISFKNIYIQTGNIGIVKNNNIGATSGNGAITVSFTSGVGTVAGIDMSSNNPASIQSNNIGSITVTNTGGSTAFYGIQLASTGPFTVANNLIGSTDAGTTNSILINSSAASNNQEVIGIKNASGAKTVINNNNISKIAHITNTTTTSNTDLIHGIYIGAGTNTITDNTISDLTTDNPNISSTHQLSIGGIIVNTTSASQQYIKGNSIFNLSNTYNAFAGSVVGIYYNGGITLSGVAKNFINSLSVNAATTAANLYGIKIAAGKTTYSNNVISIGDNNAATYYGIYETGATNNDNQLYYNTIYLGGVPTLGSNSSYALYSNASTNTRDFRNNIFSNTRSNSGATGSHFATYFNYAANTNLTLNYNNYYAPGTGGILGYYNSANATVLPLVTGNDVNSLVLNPGFATPGGTVANNYAISATLNGATTTGINTDFLGNNRSITVPKMGALEAAVVVNNGNSVDVYASNVLQASYTNLKTAFDAINAGTHTGALTLKLTASQSLSSSAIINASGNGAANYSSILIYPTITGLTIAGEAAPLIDLNGADNITIDGRLNATGTATDLTISNTLVLGIGNATIRFINDASDNTIKYCTIKGATVDAGTGILIFGIGVTAGNNNNTIDHNNITNLTNAQRPVNGIISEGLSVAVANSNGIISNNNFYDFFNAGIASLGINLKTGTTAWQITGNSFYETTTFSPTASVSYTFIGISNSAGVNFTVSNNFIGGSAPLGAGSQFTKTASFNNVFYGLNISVGSATASNIQGNTIKNINWSNAAATNFYCINASTGKLNVGTITGNTIGASTGNRSIIYTNVGNATFNSISLAGNDELYVQNNLIGAIELGNSTSNTNFVGISIGGTASNSIISNNTIGSMDGGTTNSIYSSSASAANPQSMVGINITRSNATNTVSGNTISKLTNGTTNATVGTLGYLTGIYISNGSNTVSNNTITNLTIANANNAATHQASVVGIALNYATASLQTISGNRITRLSNTNTSFAGSVIGLYYSGSPTASAVSGNYIANLSVAAASPSGNIYGIKIAAGNTTYSNNVINLAGNTNTNLFGIYEPGLAGHNTNLFYNTVFIGGSPAAGLNKSYALYNAFNGNVRDFRNNIFQNSRSTAGENYLHYAAYLNYTSNANLTMNYNNYYTVGTNTYVGYLNSVSYPSASFNSWKTVTGSPNIIYVNPLFANVNGTSAVDLFSSVASVSMAAQLGTGITTDFSGLTRSASVPHMGAFDAVLPPAPTITNFSPTSASPGTTVTITGTNFTNATAVSFGGSSATSYTVVSSTSITAVVGSGSSGSVSVTAMGGTATKTGFTVISNDANLSAFTISSGTLTPSFSASTISYTVSVTGVTSSVSIKPTVNQSNATLKINGVAASSGTDSDPITLSSGNNTITVLVTAQDGTTTKTYTIVVNRPASAPAVTTNVISSIALTTASAGGVVTLDGGDAVTAKGICWSTSTNPTIADSKTTDGTGTGSFSSSITGLTANATYYFRAYATNAIGTAYGSEISFKTAQAFTLADINKVYGDAAFALTNPASNSVGTFSYTSSDNTVATISGNNVTILKAGSTTITATQAANGGYASSTTTATLTVAKADQTITLTIPASAPLNTFIGTSASVIASSTSGLTVAITKDAGSSAAADLVNNAGSYTITNVASTGTVTITATQAGNENYNPATVSKSFNVTLGNATLNFSALTPVIYSTGLTVNLSSVASTNATGATIVISVVSGPATLSGNTLTITSAGTVKLKASQAATSNWNAATDVIQDLLVNQAAPTVGSFTPTAAVSLATVTITGTDFDNASAVSFGGVAANSFIVVNSTTITAVIASGSSGAVSVTTPSGTASKSGFTWLSTDATLSALTISSGTLDPSFDANTTSYTTSVANSVTTINTTATLNQSNASITINGTAVSSGSPSSALALNVGDNTITIVVTAQDGSTTKTYSITVTRAATFATISTTNVSAIGSIDATSGGTIGSDGGATVTARGVCWSTTTNPTTANAKTIDGTGTGSFSSTIIELVANTKYYIRAYAVNSIGTSYGTETSFTTNQLSLADINKNFGDAAFTIPIPATNSLGAISYTSSNTSVATISGNTVTIVAAGTTTITADQAANGNYASQSVSATLTVAKANQVITLSIPTTAPLNTFTATTTPVTASSTSGLVVTVEKDAASTATATLNFVSDGNYTLTGVASTGTIIFNATQAGNDNYNSASVSQSFDVTKGNQTISFGALTPVIYSAGMTQDLTATTSGTGLTITYTVVSGPATVSGNTLSITGTGTVKIRASQAGDVNWNAALSVDQDLIVNQVAPTISSFSPTAAANFTTVTITGTHFENTSAVSFGSTVANSFSIVSSTSITAVVGTGASGNVSVTTPGGTITQSGFSWLSSDASLSALSISSGTLSPSFGTSTTSYTVSVANNITSITVTPTVNQANATITVNGSTVASASASQNIALAVGNNTISVVVTAQDGTTIKTYTIIFTRAATTATISTIAISAVYATYATSGGNITDDGGAAVTARGVCWSSVTNPTIADSKTTNGSGTGSFSSSITGLTANTTYYVRAYATNSIGTVYGTERSFTANQQLSLADISKAFGDAAFTITNPASNNSSGAFTYTSSNTSVATIVGNTVTIVGVGSSTITVSQAADATNESQTTTAVLNVIKGNQTIDFPTLSAVIYKDVTTVNLTGATTSATGLSVAYAIVSGPGTISGNTVTPTNSGTIRIKASQVGNTSWNAAADQYQNLVVNQRAPVISSFSPTAAANGSTVTILGAEFENTSAVSFGGTAATSFTITNATSISAVVGAGASGNVSVTTPGGTITKSGFSWLSSNASLSAMSISSGTLSPVFDAATITYTASVANSITGITVTPTVAESNASIKVNGTVVTSSAASQNIGLAVGNNTVTVVVTAQDGTTTKTYTITVTRAANFATLTSTDISNIAPTTATSGGNISSDGEAAVTARGVCWSTSTNPTITDSKTTNGTGTGSFSSSITGLTANTTYYVRAYATNSIGTSYGQEISFTTNKILSLSDINKTFGEANFTILNPASNSIGAFTYSSGTTSTATINSNTVTIVGAGTSTITVTQAANGAYASQTTTALLTVAKANQILTLNIPTTAALNTFTSSSVAVSANSTSGLTVTISKDLASTANADLINSAGVYSLTNVASVGTIIINATQAGNDNYNPASISRSFDVTIGNQLINFSSLTTVSYVSGLTVDLTGKATTNATGLNISYSVVTGPGSISGNTLTITSEGTIKIKASQAGDANWNAAADTYQDLIVNQSAPAISSFTPTSGKTIASIAITGTNLHNASAVSFGSIAANSFTVNSATSITAFVGAGASGDVSVTTPGGIATKSGFSYISSDATLFGMSLSAGSLSPSYLASTTNYIATVAYVASSITLTPTVAQSNATVTVNGSTVASASASQNIALSIGNNTITVVVTAQDGTTIKTYTITVTRSATTATISTIAISAVNATTATSGGNISNDGGAAVTARGVCWSTSTNPTIADSKTVDGTGTGSFSSSITGLTANTTYYVRSYATNNIGTAYGAENSFTTNHQLTLADIAKSYGAAAFDINNPTSNSAGAFSYTSSNTSVATIVGNTVSIAGVGNSTITVTQAANGIYLSQTTTALLTVGKSDQTISFAALTGKVYGAADFEAGATSTSGLTVSYSSSNLNVATIIANQIHIVGAGTTDITATQTGNANYNLANSIIQSFTVSPKELTVSGALAQNKVYDGTNTATITGATLNGIINSDDVSLITSGTFASSSVANGISVTSTSTLAGAKLGNYSLTQPTGLLANITKAPQTISFSALSNKTIGDIDFNPGATASSGLTVSYTSSNPLVATILNNMIHIVAVGSATITASQSGNANYEAATNVTQLLNVLITPPSNLSYAAPVVYTQNAAISNLKPTVTGTVVSYAITPNLPTGLTLNTTSGIISGTPTAALAAKDYLVTATNTNGSTSYTLNITVNAVDAPAAGVAPSNLSYAAPVVYTQNTAISNLKPTVLGTVVSYSVTPALPAGLTLNTTTGIISGTPTAAATAKDYLVTATNANGSTSYTLNITVNVVDAPVAGVAPSNLSYAAPVVYTQNTTISNLKPTVIGTVVSYSVTPALPAGLTLNITTGIISGTPTTAVTAKDYLVTATNTNGSTSYTLNITVNAVDAPSAGVAPSNLSYAAPVVYTQNAAISNLKPTVIGTVVSYSVTPALPAGLSISGTTGIISGTPTVAATAKDYLVTASNANGSTSYTLSITVNAVDAPVAGVAPSNLSYAAPVVYTQNTAISNLKPTLIGTVVSYSVTPALPAGLILNNTTGIISGTPTTAVTAKDYLVSATNANGSTSYTLNITVNAVDAPVAGVAPSNLSYAAPVVYTQNTTISNLKPTVTGIVVSYAITPYLPAGLSISGTTGIVSGTPTAAVAAKDYLVTATNTNGSTSYTLNITVNAVDAPAAGVAPSNLSYAAPVVYTQNTAISNLNPTVIGTVVSYAITPNLPAGLSISGTTGIISGTPTAAATTKDYLVTATNANGSTSYTLNITVNAVDAPVAGVAPSNLSYAAPVVYIQFTPITLLRPTVIGTVVSYNVTPALPAGLILNTTTGIISGTPTTAVTTKDYLVTATNANGSTSYTLNITVNAAPLITIPIISANGITSFCAGGNVILSSTNSASYQWYKDGVAITTNGNNSTFTVTLSGSYSVETTGINPLDKARSTELVITVFPLPVITITPSSMSVSRGKNVTLTATGQGSFAWAPITSVTSPYSRITEAKIIQNTTFKVTLTSVEGCKDSTSITIEAIEDFYVEPALVFTPNGDGINDNFIIKNLDQYPVNQLQIFDRLGKKIYEKENYNNDWNGSIRNAQLSKDTYYYILIVKGQIVKKGAITVVR